MNNLEFNFQRIVKLAKENDVEIDVIFKYSPFLDEYHPSVQHVQFVIRNSCEQSMARTFNLCDNYDVVFDKNVFLDIETALEQVVKLFKKEEIKE